MRLLRWGGAFLSVLIALVYAANVPFYSGSSLGTRWSWRMEHGRLAIHHSPNVGRESFYIAGNSEGLRFRPDWRIESAGVWYVNIPLWAPLGTAVGVTVWAWVVVLRRRREGSAGGCPNCGYDRTGLAVRAPCPECGRKPVAARSPPK